MTVAELIEELSKYPPDMTTAVELDRNLYGDIKVRCLKLNDIVDEDATNIDTVVIGPHY